MHVMRKHRALIVLAAIACGEPVPVRIVVLDVEHEDDKQLVADAFDILGLGFEFSKERGSIRIGLFGEPRVDEGGSAILVEPRCRKAVVSARWADSVAHEVAHALGLRHICGPFSAEDEGVAVECTEEHAGNLMHGELITGTDLNDEQIDELEKGRRRLTACR